MYNSVIQTRIGKTEEGLSVYLTVKLTEKNNQQRLSITGVIGPRGNGDCAGSCGQCGIPPIVEYAPGWDDTRAQTARDIWKRWHLNDMRAGSPAQRQWLEDNPSVNRGYDSASNALADAGLNPDPNYLDNAGNPYRYGARWLFEPLPESVIVWALAIPPADIPAPKAWQD